MVTESNTLFIKHLPAELSHEEQEDFLRHFGASNVRCMSTRGKLKNCAFASFPDVASAVSALKSLHQLDVLGAKLTVEFAKKSQEKCFPSIIDEKKSIKEEKDGSQIQEKLDEEKVTFEVNAKRKIIERINSASTKWSLEYPFNPKLQYSYPPPTVNILTNIANTLASIPKFYVQVLHLMNKMNLPAPFGPVTVTPPLHEDHPPLPVERVLPPEPDSLQEEQMEMSSTEESELESDEDSNEIKKPNMIKVPSKRPRNMDNSKRKRKKLHTMASSLSQLQQSNPTTIIRKPGDVFEEQPQANLIKKISINFPAAIDANSESVNSAPTTADLDVPTVNDQEIGQDKPPSENTPDDQASSITTSELGNKMLVVEGGFGKIEPEKKEIEEDLQEEEEEWGATEFISSRKLRRNRLSRSEMKDYSVFKKYESGQPTSRLYIKNLTKQVNEKDLHYIFGRYVNWEDEMEKIMFDIRLMKEGRMKGQAFITLPSEKQAKDALDDTHAFLLHGKPMVVQFARSAKPKPDAGNKK